MAAVDGAAEVAPAEVPAGTEPREHDRAAVDGTTGEQADVEAEATRAEARGRGDLGVGDDDQLAGTLAELREVRGHAAEETPELDTEAQAQGDLLEGPAHVHVQAGQVRRTELALAGVLVLLGQDHVVNHAGAEAEAVVAHLAVLAVGVLAALLTDRDVRVARAELRERHRLVADLEAGVRDVLDHALVGGLTLAVQHTLETRELLGLGLVEVVLGEVVAVDAGQALLLGLLGLVEVVLVAHGPDRDDRVGGDVRELDVLGVALLVDHREARGGDAGLVDLTAVDLRHTLLVDADREVLVRRVPDELLVDDRREGVPVVRRILVLESLLGLLEGAGVERPVGGTGRVGDLGDQEPHRAVGEDDLVAALVALGELQERLGVGEVLALLGQGDHGLDMGHDAVVDLVALAGPGLGGRVLGAAEAVEVREHLGVHALGQLLAEGLHGRREAVEEQVELADQLGLPGLGEDRLRTALGTGGELGVEDQFIVPVGEVEQLDELLPGTDVDELDPAEVGVQLGRRVGDGGHFRGRGRAGRSRRSGVGVDEGDEGREGGQGRDVLGGHRGVPLLAGVDGKERNEVGAPKRGDDGQGEPPGAMPL